ncbi:hypothetical protein [Rhodoplanes sp. Z2-YC6860]|uniref:hypothetical protein n=1 Tax=Rhodoplanes sp. Z2-YC6860 TaxID=674703 RepID=UPI0008324EA3|nr:hypothetical protein [Rhodoplanes sp. Z2-YC6860]
MRYRLVVGTTLLGFIAGTALFGFIVGAATLSVVAVATTAGAYPIGGGSPSVSHASFGIHNSMSSSLGDSGRRNTFRKPLDSDGPDMSDAATKSIGSGGVTKSGGNGPLPRRSGNARSPRH